MTTNPAPNAAYVSTGNLPPEEHVRLLVDEAFHRFGVNADGDVSHVCPSLATVDPDRFGICVANTRGLTAAAGDADLEFSIMSVAKPFVFALMCGHHNPDTVARFVGLNATGRRFNAVAAIEDRPDGRTNLRSPPHPGARAHYDRRKSAGARHVAAQRNVFNRLLGCQHHCLHPRQTYDESTAFPANSSTSHARAA